MPITTEQLIKQALEKIGESTIPMNDVERTDLIQNQSHDTLPEHLLREVECTICRNTGVIPSINNGILSTRECECMSQRRTLWRVRKSGLSDMVQRYKFETFQTVKPWQKQALSIAQNYAMNASNWMFISGNPGSGKTHLCIAVTNELIKSGREAVYMMWREDATRLKALVNDRNAYEKEIKRYKNIDVLYIDDFFKGTVSDADINLAFELLNARYNDSKKLTIISTEKGLEDILGIDEAIGSRIYERSKGNCFRTPNENWRLK